MKKLMFMASLALATATALAQGTVNFQTKISGFSSPVYDVDGVTLLSGTNFKAQLYAGLTADSLAAVGSPAPFKTSILKGYVGAGTVVLPWPGGTTVFIQMRAWNAPHETYEAAQTALGGKWGFSNTISVLLTEPPTPPADLVGLRGFHLIPEPSTTALAFLGGAALLLRCGARKLPRRPVGRD